MIATATYLLVIAALVGLAAAAAEGALRARGRSVRWVWAAALGTSVGLPLLARLLTQLQPPPPPIAAAPGPVLELAPMVVDASGGGGWTLPPELLPALWAALSALLVLRLALSWLGLRQDARRWSRRIIDGVSVLVSSGTGPATLGVLRPDIVLPRWALHLDDRARRLMLAHEREHVAAGDPRLLLVGTLVCIAMPWNLPLWWQLRRLRLAVELDCDARVLRAGGSPVAYGHLLLEVGRRRSGVPALAAALAEGRSFLERRLRVLARGTAVSGRRAAALGGVAASLLVLAVCTPDPFEPAPEEAAGVVPGAGPDASVSGERDERQLTELRGLLRSLPAAGPPEEGAEKVIDTRFDRSGDPDLEPAEKVIRVRIDSLGRAHPMDGEASTGRSASGGTVWMKAVQIRPTGDVQAVDTPAYHFSAGEVKLVPGEKQFRDSVLVFEAGERERQLRDTVLVFEAAEREAAPDPVSADTPVDLRKRPTFTPYEERPELKNPREVREALQGNYPPMLRDAGIGGRADVWFFIDEEGRVRDIRINNTSGHAALDSAAVRVARVMEFAPAKNRGRPVPVWVSLPITFSSN